MLNACISVSTSRGVDLAQGLPPTDGKFLWRLHRLMRVKARRERFGHQDRMLRRFRMAAMSCPRLFRFSTLTVVAGLLVVIQTAATPLSARLGGAWDVPSGKDLFLEHCAQCHGNDGTGNGPMASVLTIKPADLTEISKRADGKFAGDRIADIIRYGGDITGHGARAMPIWGSVFSSEGKGGKGGAAYSRRAIIELKTYLESIQKK